MALLGLLCLVLGRKITPVISLVLTAEIMIMFNPFVLSSVSFQLSFASTAAMFWVYPLFFKIVEDPKHMQIRGLLESFFSSLSCLLLTSPILLWHFGTISMFGLFTNTLFLWSIPFLMGIFGVSLLVAVVIPAAIPIFAEISYYYSSLFLQLLQKCTEIPHSFLGVSPVGGVILLTLCIMFGYKRQIYLAHLEFQRKKIQEIVDST
jgi:ComEC/Rec2-related protein